MRAWLSPPLFSSLFPLAQTAPAVPVTATAPGSVPDSVGPAGVSAAPTVVTTATSQPADAGVKAPPPGPMAMVMQFAPIILIVVVVYFIMIRGPRKEEKKRKTMITAMKRGDEVMTVGGLIGKVVEVKEDRVILKVDEANNIKETYLKSAIQSVINAGSEDAR